MEKLRTVRNITIGLMEGLMLPFALAAGLSSVVQSSRIVIIACLTTTIASALLMTVGGYLTGKKYEPLDRPMRSAFTIGICYIVGGLITTSPYFFIPNPLDALKWSAICTLTVLCIAGYYESAVNGSNGWAGALRTLLTGAIAAAAAFAVAKLFR